MRRAGQGFVYGALACVLGIGMTRQNWFLLGFGIPLAVGGVIWFGSSVRCRRREKGLA